MKKTIKKIIKSIYKFIPLPYKIKVKVKNWIYITLSPFIKQTGMYKIWKQSNTIDSLLSSNTKVSKEKRALLSPNERDFIMSLYELPKTKGKDYVDLSKDHFHPIEEDTKLIAFYLPQFHPIPENDLWWGKGFTEWTNVSKAVPQFTGHYQPHLPGELGYYDLRLLDNIKKQVELAKKYGVYGFCFYFYWFNGKRLLEKPLDQFVMSDEIDFPFCLCWANENWTRRWDGAEHDILLKQTYSEGNDIEFIKDLSFYLKNKNYIRINGRPLVLIYRPSLLPNFKKTVSLWREYCNNEGLGEIYVLGVKWGIASVEKYGLDGLVEFPPHSMNEYGCELINDNLNIMNPDFEGLIFDYKKFVEDKNYLFDTDYPLYKAVSPSWDNTARKINHGTIYHNSTPSLYKTWLKDVIQHTKKTKNIAPFVFVNAWNEWAEGAHLEPDKKYGYAYLEATKQALIESRKSHQKKIIYVTHDTHFNGAQLLSLHIIQVLKNHFRFQIEIISKSDGVLTNEFRKYGNVFLLNERKQDFDKHIKKLLVDGFETAICNTVITGDIVLNLSNLGIKVISLIHELPKVIEQYNAVEKAKNITLFADKVIFPSEYVYEKFTTIVEMDPNKKVIQPQGLYKKNPLRDKRNEARVELRQKLGVPLNSKIILGVGFADKRKGIDLFAEVAASVRKLEENTYFLWVGNLEPNILDSIKMVHKKEVIFIDATPDVGIFYAGADVYLLTSREDPFPSVVMEAMDVETPVIAFKDAGGFSDIVTEQTGSLVEYLNINEMVKEVVNYIRDEELCRQKGNAGRLLIENRFDFIIYVYSLLEILGHNYKKVSVVIPNYNYEKYLKERLSSIIDQSYPVYEIVFLDDNSSDGSLKVFDEMVEVLEARYIKVVKLKNDQNSGSVFKQWMKGINLTSSNYVWIAEADDLCSNLFLEEVMKPFNYDSEVVLSYSQSKQMDESGNILADNYLDYTREINSEKWNQSYIIDGKDEISNALVIKNTIPNVSGTVFKKFNIGEISHEVIDYKIAGDLFFYVWILQKGKIAFNHKSLNYHRRHTNSVTKSQNNILHFNEVLKMQDYILNRFEITQDNKRKVKEYREFLKNYFEFTMGNNKE